MSELRGHTRSLARHFCDAGVVGDGTCMPEVPTNTVHVGCVDCGGREVRPQASAVTRQAGQRTYVARRWLALLMEYSSLRWALRLDSGRRQ
jgi:hypothetical protein